MPRTPPCRVRPLSVRPIFPPLSPALPCNLLESCEECLANRFRERSPGLNQHALTVLVLGSWVLLLPRLPPWSWSLRLFPWASILLHGPLDICLDLLPAAPLPPMQKQDAQHMFLQQIWQNFPKLPRILHFSPLTLFVF